jgi:hypothetical protein
VKQLLRRMAGAARLDADTYEEVEADPSALASAALVVGLTAAANAAGTWLQGAQAGLAQGPLAFQALISGLLPCVLWLGGSAFSYMMGASFFRGPHTETDFAEVLRTTGFAFAPGLMLGAVWVLPGLLGIGAVPAGVLLWLAVWGLSAAPLPF